MANEAKAKEVQDQQFNWKTQTWNVIDSAFNEPSVRIEHQLESFNNMIEVLIPSLMKYNMPLTVSIDGSQSKTLEILKCGMCKPIQYSKRHYKAMYPAEARYRNLTYSAPLYIDIAIHSWNGSIKTETIIEEKIHLAKIPIMVGSKYCHLYKRKESEKVALNECPKDLGGYFIVNGSEKAIISQERPVENKISCFAETDTSKPYVARAETKSTLDQRFFPIKIAIIKLTKKHEPSQSKPKKTDATKKKAKINPGHKLHVFLPYGRRPIPLFVLFKAFGIITDKEIFSYLVDNDVDDVDFMNLIIPSALDAHDVQTQIDAIRYVANSINITIEDDDDKEQFRMKYAKDLLNREFLPHVGNSPVKKLRFISLMVRNLLNAYLDPSLYSDRDDLTNKRLDLPGTLLSQIFRYWFQRLLKDIKQHFNRVLSASTQRDTATGISLGQDIRRLIQKSNIENKLKYALATGNWFTNRAHANAASKKGIAQVLSRMAYLGTLSHLNRITSPLERAGSKHEPPRRLHGTQPPNICPNETPEGAQVGTVKNLALLTHVSIETSAQPVLYALEKLGMLPIEEISSEYVHRCTKILVNGDFMGVAETLEDADRIYQSLVFLKRTNTLSCFISIAWHHDSEVIIILSDGGRYSVPYYTIDEDNNFKMDNWVRALYNKQVDKEQPIKLEMDVLTGRLDEEKVSDSELESYPEVYNSDKVASAFPHRREAALEYLDTNELTTLMVADSPERLYDGQTLRLVDGVYYGNLTLTIDLEKDDLLKEVSDKLQTNSAYAAQTFDALVKSIVIINDRYIALTLKEVKPTKSQLSVIINLNRFICRTYVRYTHCLTHPATINGVVATNIPFSDHNQSPRNCYQSSMGKQAIGIYATNYHMRMDTMTNILAYPHRPVVATRTSSHTGLDSMHHGFLAMVAIACYGGYNQEDSLLGNRDSAQRGTFNTVFYRTYTNRLKNLPNQDSTGSSGKERFAVPPSDNTMGRKVGAGGKDRYHAIRRNTSKGDADRNRPELPIVGTIVGGGDIIIPKSKEINKKKGQGSDTTLFSDSSTTVRPSEEGVVDMVIPNNDITNNEDEDGYRFVKVRICDMRQPEIGDKFASRHAQKGTEGIQYDSADMMFNQCGTSPDKVMNPQAVPSRMTQGQLNEALCSKEAVLKGTFKDATPFTEFSLDAVKDSVAELGYDYAGDEIMYNGHTGDMFEVPIFFNPTYYQRLKHMVADKMHARNLGPVQSLTKQPAEGRARLGGLRVGEMERDCFIAHGCAQLLKSKLTDSSDVFEIFVSRQKQTVIAANPALGIYQHGTKDIYGTDDIYKVHLPYPMNLFRNELRVSMIDVKLILES